MIPDSHDRWTFFVGGHRRQQTQHLTLIQRLPFRADRAVEWNEPRRRQSNRLEVPISQIADSLRVNYFPEADALYLQFPSVSGCDVPIRAREHKPVQIAQARQNADSTRRKRPGQCKPSHPQDNKMDPWWTLRRHTRKECNRGKEPAWRVGREYRSAEAEVASKCSACH